MILRAKVDLCISTQKQTMTFRVLWSTLLLLPVATSALFHHSTRQIRATHGRPEDRTRRSKLAKDQYLDQPLRFLLTHFRHRFEGQSQPDAYKVLRCVYGCQNQAGHSTVSTPSPRWRNVAAREALLKTSGKAGEQRNRSVLVDKAAEESTGRREEMEKRWRLLKTDRKAIRLPSRLHAESRTCFTRTIACPFDVLLEERRSVGSERRE